MVFGVTGAIVEAIMAGPEGSDYASMSIAGVNPVDPTSDLLLPERTFQFWPASISDSISIGWSFKDIPGMSHALAQWSSNGGRTISFEVQLHRFMKPVESRSIFETVLDPFGLNAPASQIPKDNRPHNVDIKAEIKYLRAYCYPSYRDVDGYRTAYTPPIAMLYVPGHGFGDSNGNDIMYAVVTACDITHTLDFPDGTPRKASVSMTFRQVVQDPFNKTIYQVGHDGTNIDSWIKSKEGSEYKLSRPTEGGNRSKNNLDGWKGGKV